MNESTRYLAQLSGINLGGNNIIKMADLKACFETIGFTNVATYIQRGNVIFVFDETEQKLLETHIEKVLSETFNYKSHLVVISHQHLKALVEKHLMNLECTPKPLNTMWFF